MSDFVVGQCWVSETEPELGVCRVLNLEGRRVTVYYASNQETRIYSSENAPLKRVVYNVGDSVYDQEKNMFTVVDIKEQDGLFWYSNGTTFVSETDLDSDVDFSGAADRLANGEFDSNEQFNVRYRTLLNQQIVRKGRTRGLIGGRVELIPHQFYVVNRIVEQYMPRVLLADEVGLGKTIEACLVMHRLLLTGQITRVLILLPEALIHQWFIELFRRFNLTFSIIDEERCQAMENGSPEDNPFQCISLALCGLDFLVSEPKRAAQVANAGWDLLIVDEAHHLEWSVDAPSSQYLLVEALSRDIERLVLLSGTPEQLGVQGHFARLKLLDPDRYYDLDKFLEENRHYNEIAEIADKLLRNLTFDDAELTVLSRMLPEEKSDLAKQLKQHADERQDMLNRLLDYFGTGRVVFRNTRHVVKGFPKRHAGLVKLASHNCPEFVDYLRHEFDVEKNHKAVDFKYDYRQDPRILWLAETLKGLGGDKLLLICHSKEKAAAIEKALLNIYNVKMALFHEDMTILQRDRNAAWFAEKDGAQLLVCSEIGSEGRNFQFASHLVLYDLPMNPELLEQRIGRLDRIGQKRPITIHIPYLANSPQEVLAKWYHEGLNAVELHLPGGHEFIKPFTEKILDLAIHSHLASEIATLIDETRLFRDQLVNKLEHGRDHLLELNSLNPRDAESIVNEIKHFDYDPTFEAYILDVFEQFGVQVEAMSRRSFLISPANCLYSLPGLPTENMTATCSRAKALEREDISFLTWDHPLVRGSMDMITSSPFGNCAFAVWEHDGFEVLLEAVFSLECQAPLQLHADRFLSPTPVRVLVNHLQQDLTDEIGFDDLTAAVNNGPRHLLEEYPDIIKTLLPTMVETCHDIAEVKGRDIVAGSLQEMQAYLGSELKRLHVLMKNNANIQEAEITRRMDEIEQLSLNIGQASTRLDALRIVLKGPFNKI